jgi:hypothetical protein
VRLVTREQMRKAPARRGRRLEAAVAPAAIEIKTVVRRAIDDGRAVHRHIHDAAPGTQHAHAPDGRHQRHRLLTDILDSRQVASLGIRVVAVDIAAEDETTLVGLADVEVPRAKCHDGGNERLDCFGDERL